MKPQPRSQLEILKEHLLTTYSPEDVDKIFAGFTSEKVTTLRINTLKISPELFKQEAEAQHVLLEPIDWYNLAFILRSPTLREFTETDLYKQGKCYVQSFSSMLPALILNPQKNERILDMCAAPGSKTTQMAMLMENTGEIIANDSSHTRIYRLKANLEQQGVTNTIVIRKVGQGLWHDYPEYFDKVLVDVPCSMEGRIRFSDEKTYQDWSVKKVRDLQEIQKFLLRSAISATKPGGEIVYSTCTLSIQENEAVIDWILRKEAGKISLEDIVIDKVPWIPPLRDSAVKTLAADIIKTKKLFPSPFFEGFYIAKLKKS